MNISLKKRKALAVVTLAYCLDMAVGYPYQPAHQQGHQKANDMYTPQVPVRIGGTYYHQPVASNKNGGICYPESVDCTGPSFPVPTIYHCCDFDRSYSDGQSCKNCNPWL